MRGGDLTAAHKLLQTPPHMQRFGGDALLWGLHSLADIFRHLRPTPFFTRVAVPSLLALAFVASALAGVALFAADQANQLSGHRQEMLIRASIKEREARIGYEQESITVWNESLKQASAAAPDLIWFDDNLGIWLHDYYGHDEAYVLRPDGRPFYAMRDGKRTEPSDYDLRLGRTVPPLVAKLREHLLRASKRDIAPPQRVAGARIVAVVGGHPAIVSVKPITNDGGEIPSVDAAPVHVSIRRLDGNFAATVAKEYGLREATFERKISGDERRYIALSSASGGPIGYFAWRPFQPGAMVLARVAPFAGAAFLVLFGIVIWLLRRFNRALLAQNASEAQARHLAFHDALTGLPNAAQFKERLSEALAGQDRAASPLALLHLKVDGIEQIIDAFGQSAGEALISAVAERLAAAGRSEDLIAHTGAAEFAILQGGGECAAAAEIFCMRIVEEFAEPFRLGDHISNVDLAIGIALAPHHATTAIELDRRARLALRHAAATPGTRYAIYDDAMDGGIRGRLMIESDLRDAILRPEQFELLYQPLVSASSGHVIGAEALLRWHHPERGKISPTIFIPIAETSGIILKLGSMVLRRACEDARRWNLPMVAVNVSALQIRDPQFASQTLAILKETGLAPTQLEIEITETTLLEDDAGCRKSLAALRAQGVKVALDDFGTGYSSFSYLRKFDIDRIKIDRSFVSGIDMRGDGRAIVKAMIDLAKASALKVTAEGVERDKQRQILAELGCDTLQGFHLFHPMPVAEVAQLVDQASLSAS